MWIGNWTLRSLCLQVACIITQEDLHTSRTKRQTKNRKQPVRLGQTQPNHKLIMKWGSKIVYSEKPFYRLL